MPQRQLKIMSRRRKPFLAEKVTITDLADRGKGIGRTEDGKVVFATGVAPGDVVDILAKRKKKGMYEGQVQHFHEYSSVRTEPFCSHFGLCGGCKLQHIQYEEQLRIKQSTVENALQRIAKVEVGEIFPIIGATNQQYYRNKLEFSFSAKRWLTAEEINTDISNRENVLGFHPGNSFDKVINLEHCYLQYEPSNTIRNTVREIANEQGLTFYDAYAQVGFMRQLMVRITSLGEIMVVVSIKEDAPKKIKTLLDAMIQQLPSITSLYYCINGKKNDYMYDLEMVHYHGKEEVTDQLGDIQFKIGPKSFFQTNTQQAEALYQTVVDFAEFKGTENVYDLYTGIGSIALFLAKHCQQVVGIEEIEAAIEDAKTNAALNNITNTTFYAGDVKKILTPEFAQQHGKPDILITDPPRAGMHPKVVQMLLQLEAPKLIYVSCKPSTQARDLQILSEKYEVLKSRAVDMFPHTPHIENVVVLKLKGH